MENPGASGARNALLSEGAEMVPVAVDDEGLVVGDGLAKAPHFRLAFVTPSHQQPLGHVMSLPRRLELLQAAEKAQALYQRYSRLAGNSIERHMKDQLGLSSKLVNSAQRQQGLIQIYRTPCTQGRCNDCPLSQPQARHHVYV